jgi:chromate transporter
LHRVRGGLVAGTLFVLPGVFVLTALSLVYAEYGHVGGVQALFLGLKAAVLAVVVEAVIRVGKRALKQKWLIAVAGLAFIAIFAFAVPFPLIVLSAALIGFAAKRAGLPMPSAGHTSANVRASENAAVIDAMFAREAPDHVRPSLARFAKSAAIGLFVWLGPLAILLAALGPDNVFTAIAGFNSKMAVVTFGGAYAVLAYMAQQAVEHYRWLRPGEMLVGLGFAETTPGPLICVVQFVGFIAAFRAPGGLDPAIAGVLGGLLAMWSTFVPPFIWIFAGGPYVEALIGNVSLNAALSAITAAVVGVILNLAVWFGVHAVFAHINVVTDFGLHLGIPDWRSVSWTTLTLAIAAGIAIFGFRLGMLKTLAFSSLASLALYAVNG